MSMLVFCVVTPCGLTGRYKCFGETLCLHLQCDLQSWRWEQYIPPICRSVYLQVHTAWQPRRQTSIFFFFPQPITTNGKVLFVFNLGIFCRPVFVCPGDIHTHCVFQGRSDHVKRLSSVGTANNSKNKNKKSSVLLS
jgi:hypothetical protein